MVGDQAGEPRVVGLADVMAVEILELLHVEPRRRLADMVEVEPGDRLFLRDDLAVAVAPAESQEIIEQGLGEDAELVAIGIDAQRAMPLRQFGAVGAVDQRNMGIGRLGPFASRG